MRMEYLPINRTNIEYRPDRFAVNMTGVVLIFQVSWNPVAQGFFLNLLTRDGKPIIEGRRLVYGQDILDNISDDRVPDKRIIPFDPSGNEKQITFDNFMRPVKPYILEPLEGDGS